MSADLPPGNPGDVPAPLGAVRAKASPAQGDHPPIDPDALRKKVAWHILPLVFILYIVAYLDRTNLGAAKLRMQGDLHFSETVFGLGIGIFFIGYLVLEIPGALLVERWSARKWFARILVSWGLVSACTAFVTTPTSFYIVRFLLGVAEAGFFPGLIVYFTHWFTAQDRARALSGMVLAVPFSLAAGAPISGWIMDHVQAFNLPGWKWLFILEGAPAVILGVITLFVLKDHPRDAEWLEPHEQAWLEDQLEQEAASKRQLGRGLIRDALKLRTVWLLALGIFATNTGGYTLAFCLPSSIKLASNGTVTNQNVLWLVGLVYFIGMAGVYLSGRSSDLTGDRKWHCALGMGITGLFVAGSTITGQPLWVVMLWFCGMGFTTCFWPSPFWALPTVTLTASAAAVSIAFINMFGNIAGFLGNSVFGMLKDHHFTDRQCLLFPAACFILGAFFISLIQVQKTPVMDEELVPVIEP